MSKANKSLQKIKNSFEGRRLLKHLSVFMKKAKLLPNANQRCFVALSAGGDSVLLLYILRLLVDGQKRISALHINHGVRKESFREELWAKDLCQSLNIELKVKKANFNNQKNFENEARKIRYNFFKENMTQKDDICYLGHHIDDAFEWSLLQQFKSTSITNLLGIPVKRGHYYRPFMCLTKNQILHFLKLFEIDYCQDQSNFDLKYERNYIRNKLIPSIQKKYPKYLKQFCFRANELSMIMNVSCFGQKKTAMNLFKDSNKVCGLVFSNPGELLNYRHEIKKMILEKSTANRGTIGEQMEKLLNGLKSNSTKSFLFSGQVKVIKYRNILGIFNLKISNKIDKKIKAQIPERFSLNQYEQKLSDSKFLVNNKFPYWVYSEDKKTLDKILPGLKKTDEMTPEYLKNKNLSQLWVRPAHDLLFAWKKNANFRDLKVNLIL